MKLNSINDLFAIIGVIANILFSCLNFRFTQKNKKNKLSIEQSSPDSCVKCYTMFLPFLLIKIDVFS
ncbi:hypothetical protein DRJ90_15420 [Enterococcus faecalis]|nr:hypothetical protein DRJ90_15420 [Enterococcus faecalis]